MIQQNHDSTVMSVLRFDDNRAARLRRLLPKGTRVNVRRVSKTGRDVFMTTAVVGTVIDWCYEPTGAWYSKNGDPNILNADGKFQLLRLRMTKDDGEITDTIIEHHSIISRSNAEHAERRTGND